jgi:methionyl-tRNA synthetase
MPVKLIVHDHWMKEKKKMSKSIGNVVDPIDLLKRFSRDEMRVYMLAEGP